MTSAQASTDHRTATVGPEDFASRSIPLDRLDPPAAGEAHAWYLDLTGLARPLRGALDGHLESDDPAPFTPGQLRFARRFYLRLLLGAYLGLPGKAIRINRSVRGKPVLDASVHEETLHFSMAKSEDRLLLGFARSCPLGVDLEPLRRQAFNPLGVARRYFSAAESTALAALEPAELQAAFLRTWACKEAVVKASGQGIANQLCRFTVETGLERPAAVLAMDDGSERDWTLSFLRPEEQFLGALAAPEKGLRLSAFRLLPAAVAAVPGGR
jgi:4'-phosphopantetheinyl transferase